MVSMRQYGKFRADQSNHCGVMAILRFFKNGDRPPSWIIPYLKI